MSRLVRVMLLCLILSACQVAEPAAQPLPTVARLPSAYRIEDAERVALNFLDAWRAGDVDAMYVLLSFASQEATPFNEFALLYQLTQEAFNQR
jgi:hypothetical protein